MGDLPLNFGGNRLWARRQVSGSRHFHLNAHYVHGHGQRCAGVGSRSPGHPRRL